MECSPMRLTDGEIIAKWSYTSTAVRGVRFYIFALNLSRFSTKIAIFLILVEFSVGDEIFFPFRTNVIKC